MFNAVLKRIVLALALLNAFCADTRIHTKAVKCSIGVEDRRSLETSPSILDCSCGADRLSESIADAKLYEYRGKTIAGFELHGVEMMCLPQAFETFLKDLLGGLHTVYTKLKRLQIQPVVCNVEQVRALRSLGAIQQGVNRCKLISRNDFDRLYDDCCNI
ncbi:unnamed protein product [Gongylonema pulchrum]|uniref:Ski_Sno domain-containing protein n=1 Tax=Gongylonema pulchrum TaxID=637853 RepID=A0A183D0F4_9BILA|nr:unnamed protein product [Gongylonema pulchrum]